MKHTWLKPLIDTLDGVGDRAGMLSNFGSVTVIAVAGTALNFTIGAIFGFEGLGVFSQALIFFLILGQVAAGGFAFAMLYYFSRNSGRTPEARTQLVAAMLPVSAVGAVLTALLWFGAGFFGEIVGSLPLAEILPTLGISVFLFGLNKVGIYALNGMNHLKSFALLQGIRMPLMLLALALIIILQGEIEHFGLIFLASELVIFFLLIGLLIAYTARGNTQITRVLSLVKSESGRGWRGALIGLLADVNSKVDVLVLSLLMSDKAVGVYALGLMFSDGLRMVLSAVQTVINPQVAKHFKDNDRAGFDVLQKKLQRLMPPLSLIIVIGATGFLALIAPIIMKATQVHTSTLVFLLIALASTIAAPALILNQVFSQAGKPGQQTAFLAILAAVNLVLNLALVPQIGLLGAAVGTAIAELSQILLLRRWVPKLWALK